MPPYYFLKTKLIMHWGIVCRVVPFSKSRPSIYFPPPSTLIGALAYPLSRQTGMPEILQKGIFVSSADFLLKFIKSVHLRPKYAYAVKSDLSRVYWVHYARREAKSDAVALEKVYTFPIQSSGYPEMDVIFLVDASSAERNLGGDWMKKLVSACWSIVRVGQKECIVSAESVKMQEAQEVGRSYVEISYYTPLEAIKRIMPEDETEYQIIEYYNPWLSGIGDYAGAHRTSYIIPFSEKKLTPTVVKAEVSENGVVFSDGEDVIVTCRRWLT